MTVAQSKPMKPFFILWTGQALSLIGSQAVQFALIWWLTLETGSATVLATASLIGLVPTVALGPFAGAIVDRWNRKTVMLLSDGLVAVASLGLALLFIRGEASIAAVYVILAARALGAAFHQPAMMASTTLMVPDEHLTRIQGLNQMMQGGLLIISAPLGGLLVSLLSMSQVMLIDCATALIAIIPLLFIHVPQPTRTAEEDSGSTSGHLSTMIKDVMDGLKYLRQRKGHLGLIALASMINMFVIPAFSLLPLLVLDQLKGTATQFAWISSVFGIGMFAGGILLGIWGGFQKRIHTVFVGMFLFALAILAVGLSQTVLICMLAMFSIGVFVPAINGPIQAIIQATIAHDYQGRVLSLLGSIAGITAPIGLLLAAPVAELMGVRSWYIVGAGICVLMAIIGVLTPAIMNIEGDQPSKPIESSELVAGAEPAE